MTTVSIQSLDLDNAFIAGEGLCIIQIEGSDLVCYDEFERPFKKLPFTPEVQYRLYRGLPSGIGINEMGHPVEFDCDKDEYEEEPCLEILSEYSYIQTLNFTLIIRNQ